MAVLVPLLIAVLPAPATGAEPTRSVTPRFVAGLAAHQRPAGAPVVREFAPAPRWRSYSLTGVSEPVPASLGFLNSQGAWYTPFNHPGMPGYYDLRNWHHGSRESTKASR